MFGVPGVPGVSAAVGVFTEAGPSGETGTSSPTDADRASGTVRDSVSESESAIGAAEAAAARCRQSGASRQPQRIASALVTVPPGACSSRWVSSSTAMRTVSPSRTAGRPASLVTPASSRLRSRGVSPWTSSAVTAGATGGRCEAQETLLPYPAGEFEWAEGGDGHARGDELARDAGRVAGAAGVVQARAAEYVAAGPDETADFGEQTTEGVALLEVADDHDEGAGRHGDELAGVAQPGGDVGAAAHADLEQQRQRVVDMAGEVDDLRGEGQEMGGQGRHSGQDGGRESGPDRRGLHGPRHVGDQDQPPVRGAFWRANGRRGAPE